MSLATSSIYTFLPVPPTENPKFLSELGRATRRGIRKCPKCGTYNGTRGILCKNKLCDAVFKDHAYKRQVSLEAVKLVGTVRQVYSVKVKEKGPDHRGFVQLPFLDNSVLSEDALCFVDSCQRLFDEKMYPALCVHVDSAIKSQDLATPIECRQEVLNSLNVSKEIKTRLGVLASEKEAPLVQRVSRSVMVVKCQVTAKHPLGYLHLTFGCTKGRDTYDKYCCSCTEFTGITTRNIRPKCLHYYACVCALKADPEFKYFTSTEFQKNGNPQNLTNINSTKITKRLTHTKHVKKPKPKIAKPSPQPPPMQIKILQIGEPIWKFQEWLSHVTESINQTMLFENYGNLNSLNFFIPEEFFLHFCKRIPAVYPEGSSYRIMSILHLKAIFDTVDVKLKISKRFILDNLKGYIEYEGHGNVPCQPSFIFFLNVGQSTVDESDNVNNPFIIDWTPIISRIAKLGQLKLQYKFGRKNTN